MKPLVKICGITSAADADMCIRYGADILGFITEYPRPVPWNLDAALAKALIGGVRTHAETCVVTSGEPDSVLRLVRETKPDYLQLHGSETPDEAAFLAAELPGVRIIKAVFPHMPDLYAQATAFEAAGVYALLLDPRNPENAAHGGEADLSIYKTLSGTVKCPVILAGGLNASNIHHALKATGAPAIDVLSGVEARPGVKDEAKLSALIAAL